MADTPSRVRVLGSKFRKHFTAEEVYVRDAFYRKYIPLSYFTYGDRSFRQSCINIS